MAASVNGRISWVLLIVLTLVYGLAGAGSVEAAPPAGRLSLVNAHSGLCLTIAGGGRGANAEVVQFPCDGDPSRAWSFTQISGSDIFALTNLNSGLCLTVAGGAPGPNVTSVQFTCDSDPSRRWRLTPVAGGKVRLVNVHSGLCLTIAGGATYPNAVAVQFACDGDPSRDWVLSTAK